jgi:hypothetical protein
MLRVLTPSDTPPSASYPVPWRVIRARPGRPCVVNASNDRLEFVRVFIDESSGRRTEHWGPVLPGEAIDVCLRGSDPDDAVITLAWFPPGSDLEYCWRFVT